MDTPAGPRRFGQPALLCALCCSATLLLAGAARAQASGPDDSDQHPVAPPAVIAPAPPASGAAPNPANAEANLANAEASPANAEANPANAEANPANAEASPANARPEDASEPLEPEKPRSGWAALPVAVYAPETRLGVGAFGSLFFRVGGAEADTRPSSLSIVGIYTLRKQMIFEVIPELYWDKERWHLWSRIDYRKYPNRLWAVGSRASDDSEERYQESRPRWQLRIGRAVAGRLFIYGHLEAQHMALEGLQPGGLLETGAVPGADGGRTVGVGPGVAWDTRDHLLVPHDGYFHEVVVMTYQPALGSEHDFNMIRVNLRRYVPITREHTLALQYYAVLQQGEVPFYMMAQVGGQNLLRGHFEGRYRDQTLMAIQAEYRLPLFWRFGAVAHAAVGDVSRSLQTFGLSAPEWSLGTGLRVMLNTAEKLNLRADFGFGYDTWGLYVSVAEAF